MTIYKYPILGPTEGFQILEMPVGAQILCVQLQNGEPHLWARVNPVAQMEERKIKVVGTGHTVDHTAEYLGTYQQTFFVWHVFELVEE